MLAALDWPPLWTLGHIALAYVASWVWAFGNIELAIVGVILVVAAGFVMAWAAFTMRANRTTVVPRRDPTALVTRGPFGITRNPIYAADILALIGFSFAFGQPLAALLAVPLWRVLDRRFARPEEQRLYALFGERFADYARTIPRWF